MLFYIMEENKSMLKGNKAVEPFVGYLTIVKIFHKYNFILFR